LSHGKNASTGNGEQILGDRTFGATPAWEQPRMDTAIAWEQDLVAQLKDCRQEKIGIAGSEDRQHKSKSAQNCARAHEGL
jgi:hypothetical protein